MGAGKTAVGRVLADRLERIFFDLDEAIEGRMGMSIPEIFATQGEDAFRQAESDEVEMTTDRKGLVVATGGGAFESAENRRFIHGSGGVSIFLEPPWKAIRSRVEDAASTRPKWVDEKQARNLYENRLPTYRLASLHLDLDGGETPNEVAALIVDELSELTCAS